MPSTVARKRAELKAARANFRLTDRQREINAVLAGPQRHTLIYGGSRSGKTFLLVRAVMVRALRAPRSRHAMLRLAGNAARAALWLDTLPKVAQLCFPGVGLTDHRQDGFVSLPNRSEIWIGGLDEKDRVEKILGQEYATIYFNECSQIPYTSILTALTRLAQTVPDLRQRAYFDLNPTGSRHWTSLLFLRHCDPLTLRPLADPAQYVADWMNPHDNAANLSAEYIASLAALPDRQRRRFFSGEYQAEIDGALWTFEAIEHCRCAPEDVPATLRRVVVAIDPSGTSGAGDDHSDNVGIVVAALGDDDRVYVLADLTCALPPEGWARVAAKACRQYRADHIVAERNFGGDMVRALLQAAAPNVPVHLVTASRGKAVRAEPVSALYGHERDGEWLGDRVRHAGEFRELEDQMLSFSTAGYSGNGSPDRADALVWALTDLLVEQMDNAGIYELYRRRATEAAAVAGKATKSARMSDNVHYGK